MNNTVRDTRFFAGLRHDDRVVTSDGYLGTVKALWAGTAGNEWVTVLLDCATQWEVFAISQVQLAT